MRKYMKYIAAGLVIMIGASCEKIQETTENEIKEIAYDGYGVPMSFKAKGQDVMKSDIDVGASAIVWDSDDAIAIYDGSQLREFSVSSRSNGNKIATFSGSAADVSTYYSVTPYSAATLDTDIKVTIPATQTVIGDHCVDGEALVATATVAAGDDISFTNQFSLLKISLSGSDIVSVTLTGKSDEAICGEKVLSTSDGTFSGTPEGKTINLVYKASKEGAYGAFPAGDYFVVLWPGEFTGGFKLIMTKSDGSKAIKSTSASVTFTLNSGANASTIDDVTTWVPNTITTANQLKMWRRVAEYYAEGEEVKLGADIDLGGYAWAPATSFCGIFNGQNHKIYNFTVSDDTENRLGFIRTLGSSKGEAAVLKNVVFGSSDGANADGSSSITMTRAGEGSWMYAGIVGYAHLNSTVQNVKTFVPVTATASVTGKHAIGGIVGMTNQNVSIVNCVNRAPITDNSACATEDDSSIGGVVGWNDSQGLTVSGCENYGAVTNNCVGVSCIGGIMGKATCQSFRMEECSNHANITNAASSVTSGTNNWDKAVAVGGVLGRFGKNNNTNNYIDKCFNEGQICLGAETVEDYRQAYGGVIGTISYKCTVRGCSNMGKVYDDAVCNSDLSMGGILGSGSSSNLVLTKTEDGTPNTNDGEIFHYKKHNHETWFGGIVGYMTSSGTVEYSINNGRLVSDPSGQNVKKDLNAGGICGNSKGSILNCANNGYIFTWAGNLTVYIGGICGGYSSTYKPSRVLNCTHNGNLGPYNTTGSSITGGILARFYPSDTEVRGCTNTGLITSGNFYTGGSGNTPNASVSSYQKKDYYLAGLFGRVEAPTSDVTDNVTDCVVACTISNKTNADGCDDWTALIAGKTFSTGSTVYKLVFGTSTNPIMIVNTCSIEFSDVPASNETITTTALAKKWLMGSSSSLYSETDGSSNTDKVDFNFVLATPAQAGID